ncbi:MAG: alpha/beta fold hydrolase [Phenylobacterium sp.]
MLEPAPLIETADAKAPPGGEASWFAGAGGARLRAALFTPPAEAGPVRGSIILSGGRTEPIEKYYEFIGELVDRGFVVLAHDWRGQGLSQRDLPDPLKGYVRGYKTYLDDFRALLAAYADRLPKPWTAVAHSMGGCLTLLAMAHGEKRFAGAILSAPMLGLKTPFPLIFSRALTGLNLIAGRGKVYTLGGAGKPFDATFADNVLTHDPVRHARSWGLVAAEPKLALGAPTWAWIDFALRATAYLARPDVLRNVTVPVVIVSAGEDQLVDPAAQAAAARHLPQGKFITVPGAKHEILMETDPMRNIFLRALDALLGRTAPTPAAAPKPAAAPTPAPAPAPAAAPVAAKPAPAPTPAAPAAAAAKPAAAKTPAAKKPAAKKPAAQKPAAQKPPAKAAPKAVAAKAAAKPAAARTPAAAKAPAKKPTAKAAAKPAATKAPAVKKPAPKAAAKPAAAKASAVKKAPAKAAAKPAPAKKTPAVKKAAAPKPAVKKPAAKPAVVKAPAAAKKPAPKKPAAQKPAAKKPAPKKA